MKHRGRPRGKESSDESGRQTPHHHGAGGGNREQVGEDRHNRHPAKDRELYRRNANLRGQRDAKGKRQRAGARESLCDPSGEEDDAERGPNA